MARNRLTARAVHVARDGDHSDGDGLLLRVKDGRGSWVFRYTAPDGRRREQGLGRLARNNITEAGKSLTAARDLAEAARKLLREGIDPIEHARQRREQARAETEAKRRAEQSERQTLARVARAYHERVIEPHRSRKHSADWINSLEQHVQPSIWNAPIDSVRASDLLDFFVAIRRTHRETGRRIVQRLVKVYSDAVFRGLATANVAAAAAERLRELGIKRQVVSYRALPFAEVPAFARRLAACEGIAAKALLFGMLTWARTGEIRGMTWDEVHDLDGNDPRWIIPAARMKARREHVVPLSPQAVAILREMRALGQPFAFPSPRLDGRPISNMAMLLLLRRLGVADRTTVHGVCRQSASTWANELGVARADVVETALAHGEANEVRRAYNKATYLAERRALLHAWGDFVDGKAAKSNVTPMRKRAA